MAFLCINHIYDHRKIHKENVYIWIIYLFNFSFAGMREVNFVGVVDRIKNNGINGSIVLKAEKLLLLWINCVIIMFIFIHFHSMERWFIGALRL